MDLGLAGRRALVLGSTAGLGRAVAEGLAAEGAHVAVHGRDAARARSVADAIGGAAVVEDLAAPGGGARAVASGRAALGGLDVLVANTGGGRPGPLLEGDGDDDAGAAASMLDPVLGAVRAAAPDLRRAPGAGRVVLLTARSVLEPDPDLGRSAVYRSAVAAAGSVLARELAPDVRVNVVATGQFATGGLERFEAWRAAREERSPAEVRAEHEAAIPLGRVGRPEELAGVVAFLCGAPASFVTGTTVRVDGGAVRSR